MLCATFLPRDAFAHILTLHMMGCKLAAAEERERYDRERQEREAEDLAELEESRCHEREMRAAAALFRQSMDRVMRKCFPA